MSDTLAAPLPPEGGIKRLMRRRRRIYRNQRQFGGKTIKSWAEYSSVSVTVTGDTSAMNRWAYILIGLAAPLLPFYFMAIASAAKDETISRWDQAQQIALISAWFSAPILIFAGLLMIGKHIHIWCNNAEAAKRLSPKDAE